MNKPRRSPWIDGSTTHTPAILSLSLTVGMWTSVSFDVDLAVVADHQAQGSWSQPRPADDCLLADQAVFEALDVDDRAAFHDHRVLDFAVDDLTALTDGRERADEAVGDSCPGADDHRTAQDRVGDDRARLDDHAAVEARCLVDLSVDARLDLLQQQSVRLQKRSELAGVDPPARQELAADALALIDEPLDGVGDLQLASGGRGDRPNSRADGAIEQIHTDEGEITWRI